MKLKLFIILSLFSCNLFASDFFNEELKLYNELTSAFDTGFYPGCVEKTEILEQKYPESTFLISSRLKKGESLLKLGRFNHAKEVLLNSIPLMYSGTEELSNCYFLLGQTLYFQNDYEQSLNYFYKVCENSLLNKKMEFYNPSVLYSARIYFLQNEYEKSIPLLEYVLQNGKNYTMNEYEEVLQKYFISCVKSNQNSKVIDLFQKIDLSKFSSDVVLNLTFYAANAYEENKDFENAFNLYKKIIDSRDSSLLSATIARLEKMIKSNKLNYDLADIFSELKSDNSYNEILSGYWLRLGIDCYNAKDYKNALTYFSNAYESAKSSDVAIILFYEAKIFFDDGKQLDLALEKLNSIDLSELIMPAEFIDSYYSFLIRIYFTKNDYNAILPLFEKIKNPNDDDVYFTSYAMIQLKQSQNANELLKSYVNKNKNANQNVFLLFAKSLFQNNQANESREIYNFLDNKNQLTPEGRLDYAKVLYFLKNYKKSYEQSIKTNLPHSSYMAGISCVNMGDWKNANLHLNEYVKNYADEHGFRCESLYYLAYSFYRLNDFKSANIYFAQVALQNQNPIYVSKAYGFAALSSMLLNESQKAVEYANLYVKNAINDEQKLDALILASNIYADLNDFDNAQNILLSYVSQKNEMGLKLSIQCAEINEKKGDLIKASEIYKSVYTNFPQSEYAESSMYKCAEMFYVNAQYSKAIENFNTYIYNYVNGKYCERALFLCGDAYLKNKDFNSCIMFSKNLLQTYPQSIYSYGANKNIMNAYFFAEDYKNSYAIAKNLMKNHNEQALQDGIARQITVLEKLLEGRDKEIVLKESEYEELGKEKTVEGRKIGSELVQIYLKHDEEKQSLLLAETLIKFQKTDEEKILLAENSKVIANIYRKENKNKDSALYYLQAAENFRSNKDFSTQAAECLYSAVEAFVANGDLGDAKATAQLLIELYPQTRQAKRVNALIK